MTGDIDIFDRIPICFGSILSYSRDEKKRERERRDAFWKRCSSFNVFRDVANADSSLASFFHREGESKSRKRGGRARRAPSALQSCAM